MDGIKYKRFNALLYHKKYFQNITYKTRKKDKNLNIDFMRFHFVRFKDIFWWKSK